MFAWFSHHILGINCHVESWKPWWSIGTIFTKVLTISSTLSLDKKNPKHLKKHQVKEFEIFILQLKKSILILMPLGNFTRRMRSIVLHLKLKVMIVITKQDYYRAVKSQLAVWNATIKPTRGHNKYGVDLVFELKLVSPFDSVESWLV